MKYIYFSLFLFTLISCSTKNQETTSENISKPLMNIKKSHPSAVGVQPRFLKDVASWSYLKAVDSFLVNYKKITPSEALNNALELKELVEHLKDSIKPKVFDSPSFTTRINILFNETLRLEDMVAIGAVSANDVNKQVAKIIDALSAVHLKINAILLKATLEDEMVIQTNYIGLDTTRIDTISMQTIQKRRDDKYLKKPLLEKFTSKRN